MFSLLLRRIWLVLLLLPIPLASGGQKPSAEEKTYKPLFREGWLEIHSPHFKLITDGGEKRGREVAVRLEQMRAVFGQLIMHDKLRMPVPVEVLALGDKDYQRVAPVWNGSPISVPGFFLSSEDKYWVVLNLFDPEPWRAIAHPFAHVLLDGNYPPTQAWFDEGLAEYFASIQVDDKKVDIGGDPELTSKYSQDLIGNITEVRNPTKSLTELLQGPLWLSMTDLLSMHLDSPEYHEGTHHTLFYAQSWMVVEYLLAKKMLPQIGTYFQSVEVEKVPVNEACQKAFGMTPEELETAVKEYFKSLLPLFLAQDNADQPGTRNNFSQISEFPVPLRTADVSIVVHKLNDDDGHAFVGEVMVRQPEHREQGFKDLRALAEDPIDNPTAHRALGYAYMQQKDFKRSGEELAAALEERPNDPWTHYDSALLRFKISQATAQPMEGVLANVQQSLKVAIDGNPDFAEAYHLLGLAQLEGGGVHAALDSMRMAIQLSPRKEWYVYNLAEIYLAGKKWEEGRALLERLQTSTTPAIATAAKKRLGDLPFMKKYGIAPERAPELEKARQANAAAVNAEEQRGGESAADSEPKLQVREPDRRSVHFLKGKIISIDCSQAPAAVITFSSGSRILKLHTIDFKSMALIGADTFSCDWRGQAAQVNYRARGSSEGDLISLELK